MKIQKRETITTTYEINELGVAIQVGQPKVSLDYLREEEYGNSGVVWRTFGTQERITLNLMLRANPEMVETVTTKYAEAQRDLQREHERSYEETDRAQFGGRW